MSEPALYFIAGLSLGLSLGAVRAHFLRRRLLASLRRGEFFCRTIERLLVDDIYRTAARKIWTPMAATHGEEGP